MLKVVYCVQKLHVFCTTIYGNMNIDPTSLVQVELLNGSYDQYS